MSRLEWIVHARSPRFLFSAEEKLINQPLQVALKASKTVATYNTEFKFNAKKFQDLISYVGDKFFIFKKRCIESPLSRFAGVGQREKCDKNCNVVTYSNAIHLDLKNILYQV